MLDKAVMRLSGIHKLMGLLVGLDILQAIFIIGQAYSLSLAITGLWEGQALVGQIVPMVTFLVSYLGRHAINYVKDERLDDFSAMQGNFFVGNCWKNSLIWGRRLSKIKERGIQLRWLWTAFPWLKIICTSSSKR